MLHHVAAPAAAGDVLPHIRLLRLHARVELPPGVRVFVRGAVDALCDVGAIGEGLEVGGGEHLAEADVVHLGRFCFVEGGDGGVFEVGEGESCQGFDGAAWSDLE